MNKPGPALNPAVPRTAGHRPSAAGASGSGFTLLEVSLVVGVLSVLLLIAIAVAFNAIGRTALRSAGNIVAQSIRRAQTQSQSNVKDSLWGVYICPGNPVLTECDPAPSSVIVFSRNAFTAFNATNDRVFEINPNIALGGTLYNQMIGGAKPGLVFARFTGEPAAGFNGTIILSMGGETQTISVNSKGVVER